MFWGGGGGGGHSEKCQRGRRQGTCSTRASSKNTLRADTMTQELPPQYMKSHMVHANIELRSFFTNAEAEQDITDLSQASDAADGKKALASDACSEADARAEIIQLVSKLNVIRMEIGKL